MNKRIADIVGAMGGKSKKKGKKYVDPEEYEKMTGKPASDEEDPEEEDETDEPTAKNEDDKKKGKLFGSGLSIIIAMGKKK